MQAQMNQQSAQVAAQAEVQKNQALTSSQAELERIKMELESQKMMQEVQHKKELMALEFQYNMQLKDIEVDGQKNKEKQKEDRKDERTRIQATQQSELIEQRNSGKPPKNFESAGNDILGGGIDLGVFDPR
jgi:urease alpha subunit